jgi:GDP-L-fucose synthase
MNKGDKIFITGHAGMVGTKTVNLFKNNGYSQILTASSKNLDLRNQSQVNDFFAAERPKYVLHLAARVGGINANMKDPAVFLYDNIMLEYNVMDAAYKYGAEKLLFLGSSCIYPKASAQPIKEEYLLTGALEPTNEGYAVAKIAGIKLLQMYNRQYGFNGVSIIPSNIYGDNDSFDLQHAHVLSSLVKRFVDARDQKQDSVTLWGTGVARREFLHADDAAAAIYHFFETYNSPEIVNVGPGTEISIKALAELIASEVGFAGEIKWDSTKPDGMLRKCMDVTRMKQLGFEPRTSLPEGIKGVINSYTNLKKTSL